MTSFYLRYSMGLFYFEDDGKGLEIPLKIDGLMTLILHGSTLCHCFLHPEG